MPSVTSAALGASPGTSVMSTTATSLASPTLDVGSIIDVIHNKEYISFRFIAFMLALFGKFKSNLAVEL